MITTYRLHVNDLSVELINSIKETFRDKNVEIIVSDEVKEADQDSIRSYVADEDSFKFWTLEEEDLYQDYLKKKNK